MDLKDEDEVEIILDYDGKVIFRAERGKYQSGQRVTITVGDEVELEGGEVEL